MTEQTTAPLSEQAVALIDAPARNVTPAPTVENGVVSLHGKSFKVAKIVTRTVLKQVNDIPFYVRLESAVYQGEEISAGRGGAAKMNPAELINVENLETGELQLIIANTVLKSELDRAYPDSSYVNKCFAIVRKDGPKTRADREAYKVYSIIEIEPDEETATPVAVKVVSEGAHKTDEENAREAKARKAK